MSQIFRVKSESRDAELLRHTNSVFILLSYAKPEHYRLQPHRSSQIRVTLTQNYPTVLEVNITNRFFCQITNITQWPIWHVCV